MRIHPSRARLILSASVLVLACAGSGASPASAYNILAVEMGGYWNNPFDQYWGGIEGYGSPGAAGSRHYTRVHYSDLASTDLTAFDVLYVQSAFTDDYVIDEATAALSALQGKSGEIQQFVAGGGGLVAVTQPISEGGEHIWDWAPVDLKSTGVYHQENVEVVDAAHPVMEHSTSASLSNWLTSWHGYFTEWDARLSVLARTGETPEAGIPVGEALTLAGEYGEGCCGRMVFTMQDPDFHSFHSKPGAQAFLGDAFDWAACTNPVPEPSTWALLAGGVGLLAAARRRRR